MDEVKKRRECKGNKRKIRVKKEKVGSYRKTENKR